MKAKTETNEKHKDLLLKITELEGTANKYFSIFQHSNDAIMLIEPDEDRILDANPKASELLGYSHAELLKLPISKVHPFDMGELLVFSEEVFKKGFGRTDKLTCFTKNKEVRLSEVSGSKVTIDNKECIIVIIRDVTEKKEIEARLKQLASIVENSNEAITSVTQEGVILSWNPGAERIFGYKAKDIVGKLLKEMVPSGRMKEAREVLDKVIAGEHVTNYETVRLHKDGYEIDVSITLSPMHDENGELEAIAGITRDISEHKKIEQELIIMAAFAEFNPGPVVRLNEKGTVLKANPAAMELFNKELVGESWLSMAPMIHPKTLKDLVTHSGMTQHEYKLNNQVFMFLYRGIPNEDLVMVYGFDITERKRTELALAESELKFRGLIQSAPNGLVISSEDGTITMVNSQMEKMFRYDKNELLGKSVEQLIPLEIRERHVKHRKNFNKKSFVREMDDTLELVGLRKDGTTFPIENSLSPVETQDGVLIMSMIRDVTRRKAAETAMINLNETLELKVEERTEELRDAKDELEEAYDETLEGWMRALDMRDQETEGHTQRVTELTVSLARCYDIPEEEIRDIRRGALMHDIGKIAVPDHILKKPGPLTDEEWKIMKKHPHYAKQLLAPIDYLKPAMYIPHYHHERYDGKGYPHGLKGKKIPLPARLFAVIDVWDALTNDRPYRKAWPEEKTIAYLVEEKGKYFDPKVVDVFLENCIGYCAPEEEDA